MEVVLKWCKNTPFINERPQLYLRYQTNIDYFPTTNLPNRVYILFHVVMHCLTFDVIQAGNFVNNNHKFKKQSHKFSSSFIKQILMISFVGDIDLLLLLCVRLIRMLNQTNCLVVNSYLQIYLLIYFYFIYRLLLCLDITIHIIPVRKTCSYSN